MHLGDQIYKWLVGIQMEGVTLTLAEDKLHQVGRKTPTYDSE